MHTPDGFLSDPVCAVTALASTAALGWGVARLRRGDDFFGSDVPSSSSSGLMAATGAGVFAAQMVNFPIDHGTSGHVLGAALAAIVLGPWRGMLTMAVVLAAQCLLFGDGGLYALGANILNMAVVGTLVAAGLNAVVTRDVAGTAGKLLGAGTAALGSMLAAATLCSCELAASGTSTLGEVLPPMLAVHAWIGSVEAILTVALVAAALAARRELGSISPRRATVAGLLLAISLAGLLAPWASSAPDGLERVIDDLHVSVLPGDSFSLLSGYEAPGVGLPELAVALAGIGGALFVFASAYLVSRTAVAPVRKRYL